MRTEWHFPFMILASLVVFWLMAWVVLPRGEFKVRQRQIGWLALVVVVFGMLFGKYGATLGMPWWVYYPVPMLVTVLLPPLVWQLDKRRTAAYLALSFLSAPVIHGLFSFLLGWPEYMPFWKIPSLGSYLA